MCVLLHFTRLRIQLYLSLYHRIYVLECDLSWLKMFLNKHKICFFQAVTIYKDPYLHQECAGISISRHLFGVDCDVAEFLLKQYPNVY